MNVIESLKNTGHAALGRVKQIVGVTIGNRDLQSRGEIEEAAANLRRAGTQVKNAVKSVRRSAGF